LFEALTLVQTHKITEFPIVLVDSKYWGPLIEWLTNVVAERGLINATDVNLFHVVDTAEEAVKIVADRADEMRAASFTTEPVEG